MDEKEKTKSLCILLFTKDNHMQRKMAAGIPRDGTAVRSSNFSCRGHKRDS